MTSTYYTRYGDDEAMERLKDIISGANEHPKESLVYYKEAPFDKELVPKVLDHIRRNVVLVTGGGQWYVMGTTILGRQHKWHREYYLRLTIDKRGVKATDTFAALSVYRLGR